MTFENSWRLMVYGLGKLHGVLSVSVNIKGTYMLESSEGKVLELGYTLIRETFLFTYILSCGAYF